VLISSEFLRSLLSQHEIRSKFFSLLFVTFKFLNFFLHSSLSLEATFSSVRPVSPKVRIHSTDSADSRCLSSFDEKEIIVVQETGALFHVLISNASPYKS